MDVDTRWLSGGGYRPVRITVTPVTPMIADRSLTVEFSAHRFWNRDVDAVRVVQEIEIPAGSRGVQTTMSVPQTIGWSDYTVTVLEDGKASKRLSHSGSGDSYNTWGVEEKFPGILIVGDKLPDTGGPAALLHAEEYYAYRSYRPAPSNNTGAMPLPTAIARPAAELPRRWIDYTNFDIVCLSVGQLARLAEREPEAFRAILAWTSAGGNLCVYDVGGRWDRLPELESLLGLPPGTADPASLPPARGWREPKDKRGRPDKFGQPVGGVGRNAADPFLGGIYPAAAESADMMGMGADGGPTPLPQPRPKRRTDVGPDDCFQFVFREFDTGMIVAVADEELFEISNPQVTLGWAWLLNSIGSRRFLWYQRHGMSPVRENPEFWNLLIPGVGLAPVTGFRVLITLFVLGIGPLNYVLLRRWKSLHLLVVTVPLSAAAVTLALFGYAMVADGLGTRMRIRSFTQIDQRRSHAACWSRLSYYAGLAPFGGLTFPDDVAVIPYEYLPAEQESRTRELIWGEDQWLSSGWLPSRTPTQLITIRSRPTDLGLSIGQSKDLPNKLLVSNRLRTPIRQLLVRAKDGGYFWADNLGVDAAKQAETIALAEAQRRLQKTFGECKPQYPVGMDRAGPGGYSSWSGYGSRWSWMSSQTDIPAPMQKAGVLEVSLAAARAASLEPGSYVAIVERSPEVVVGTDSAREEASLHVILGKW